MEDKFSVAFEFYINVGHALQNALACRRTSPISAWQQVESGVRGETSLDAAGGAQIRHRSRSRRGEVQERISFFLLRGCSFHLSCWRSILTSITTISANAIIRCWRRPGRPSACAKLPTSSPPIPDSNSTFIIGAGLKRASKLFARSASDSDFCPQSPVFFVPWCSGDHGGRAYADGRTKGFISAYK